MRSDPKSPGRLFAEGVDLVVQRSISVLPVKSVRGAADEPRVLVAPVVVPDPKAIRGIHEQAADEPAREAFGRRDFLQPAVEIPAKTLAVASDPEAAFPIFGDRADRNGVRARGAERSPVIGNKPLVSADP